MIPATYGDVIRNLETQLYILLEFGVREEHIFTDEMTGSSVARPAWNKRSPHSRSNGSILRLRPVVRMDVVRTKLCQ